MKKALVIMAMALGIAAAAKAETIWEIRHFAGQLEIEGFTYENPNTVCRSLFGVWPVASGHSAGSVWTVDAWNTVNWATAGWCQNVNNQYGSQDEWWTVTMTYQATDPTSIQYWYALYVDDQYGNRYWDNNGGWNYDGVVGSTNWDNGEYFFSETCEVQ